MDIRENFYLKKAYTKFLCKENVSLVIRMVRRRVAKLSLGDYRPSPEDECFKSLQSVMREHLRVYFKHTVDTDDLDAIILSVNHQFSEKHSQKLWSDYRYQRQFARQKTEDTIQVMDHPTAPMQRRYQPLVNPLVDNNNVFENTRGENLFPELFPFNERPDFKQ
jgi:hypothetical protein